MKNTILYFLSLFIISISIFLLITFPESGRLNLIAGILVPISFTINAVMFFTKEKRS